MPMIAQKHPSGKREAMFLPHVRQGRSEALVIRGFQLGPGRQQLDRDEDAAIVKKRPAQARHGDNLPADATACNPPRKDLKSRRP